VQSQLLDLSGKSRIFLDSVEEIEGSVPVFLIFSEVEIDSGENVALGDIPAVSRNKQPCSEEMPREATKRLYPISPRERDNRLVVPDGMAKDRLDEADAGQGRADLVVELKQRPYLSVGRIEPGEGMNICALAVSKEGVCTVVSAPC